MAFFDPPVAFHFSVVFIGFVPPVPDMAFQEVSGLETSLELESLEEGGENRFVHQLPKPAKRSNLKLKRGMTTAASGLVQWCRSSLEGGLAEPIIPKDMTVSLLNEMRIPVAVWSIGNAFPVKWTVSDLDAMKNELAFETIELAYTTLQRMA
ncbi:phage tail protein [Yoonia sp. BS5-3]|uniref:Phage tail protein n=1 Tax=Yoonia phaeophyticola TaxID=3137369 RepID=A0ABZ2V3T5_9RHOB